MKLPEVEIKTQYVKFQGGIDRETPVLSIDPGALLDGMNYQPGLFGGYERVDAFERYDGRVRPSDAAYYLAVCEVDTAKTPLAGQSIYGGTSGATATIASFETRIIDTVAYNFLVLTKVVGTFVDGETFYRRKGGLPLLLTMNAPAEIIGYFFTYNPTERPQFPTVRGYADPEDDAIALNASADIYRADVGPVPGSGPVRGVHVYNGVVYAFRDDVLGAYCHMWKATSTGWVQIQMGEEIAFTGGTDTVLDGDTLTQGTATAQISRVVQTTTVASPNRVGRLLLTGRSGNFYIGPATTSSGGTLTISDLTP